MDDMQREFELWRLRFDARCDTTYAAIMAVVSLAFSVMLWGDNVPEENRWVVMLMAVAYVVCFYFMAKRARIRWAQYKEMLNGTSKV